ncbi:MAG: toll/interleukin-1 receptor domain-containing protein [Candidatus Binatia bacterium]
MSIKQTIFISHANPEDNEFTRWLGAKLTLTGYKVWYDLDRLRGGDVFWDKVEHAIREEAVRFIAVISRASHTKDGVRKEWNLASIIEKKTAGFSIPIRIDDFKFDDVTILFSGKHVIDFHRVWFEGLTQLLDALGDAKIPCATVPDAAQASLWWKSGLVTPIEFTARDERIESTWFQLRLPPAVETVTKRTSLDPIERTAENQATPWCEYETSVLGFAWREHLIDLFKNEVQLDLDRQLSTEGLLSGSVLLAKKASNNDARNLLSFLVRQAWDIAMKQAALRQSYMSNGQTVWFVPKGLKPKEVFEFLDQDKKKRRRQLVGRSEKYKVNWHYGVSAKPTLGKPLRLELEAHILFTDDTGELVEPPSRAHRLRRGFCKSWFNARWRDFQRALIAYLCQGTDCIRLPAGSDRFVEVSTAPFLYNSPVTLSDHADQASEEVFSIDQEVGSLGDGEHEEEESDDVNQDEEEES